MKFVENVHQGFVLIVQGFNAHRVSAAPGHQSHSSSPIEFFRQWAYRTDRRKGEWPSLGRKQE